MPDCPKAISAVSAIAIAQAQGQKIFTISAKNADKAIPMLQHRGSVIEEIRQAIAAGKEVTIHEKAITESGWSGAGYAVIDPETGAGAYLIEGGARGAFWKGLVVGLVVGLLLAEFIIGAMASGGLLLAATILSVSGIGLLLEGLGIAKMLAGMDPEERACFFGGFGAGLGISTFGGALVATGVAAILLGGLVLVIGTYMAMNVPTNAARQCV